MIPRLPAVLLALAALAAAPVPAFAQSLGTLDLESSDAPIEITAEDGIEWRRDEKVYLARGNARAARGDMAVSAAVLTAHYREGPDGDIEVYRIEADGNVRLASSDSVVSGGRAVYDVDKAVLVVTGRNLRAETPKALITAEDSLEYWDIERVVVARGNATVAEGDRRVEAELLTGYLRKEGEAELYQVEAEGDVVLTTADEVVRAAKAVYNLDKEFATLSGGVKITRGQNQLNGDRAEVNLKTGVSRLLGGPTATGGSDGRVRTLIVPDRKPEIEAQ